MYWYMQQNICIERTPTDSRAEAQCPQTACCLHSPHNDRESYSKGGRVQSSLLRKPQLLLLPLQMLPYTPPCESYVLVLTRAFGGYY